MKTPTKRQIVGFTTWLKKARDTHRLCMQVADNGVDYAQHRGAYLAYDNALTQTENFFGEDK